MKLASVGVFLLFTATRCEDVGVAKATLRPQLEKKFEPPALLAAASQRPKEADPPAPAADAPDEFDNELEELLSHSNADGLDGEDGEDPEWEKTMARCPKLVGEDDSEVEKWLKRFLGSPEESGDPDEDEQIETDDFSMDEQLADGPADASDQDGYEELDMCDLL